jgi:hypothetical protein
MIDLGKVDALFEAGRTSGLPVQFRVFDRGVLLPVARLGETIARETGESIPAEQLLAKAEDGWFAILTSTDSGELTEGVPLYIPSRIGFFLRLQRAGYSSAELRMIAECEEWLVEHVLTADDLSYTDDDLMTLVTDAESRVDSVEHCHVERAGARVDRTVEIGERRQELNFLRNLQVGGIPEHLKLAIEKGAFRVRALNEVIRNELLDWDRAKVEAGYSPYVEGKSQSWARGNSFKVEGIDWESTVRSAVAHEITPDGPTIRVPGFILRGDRVGTTRTIRPGEYANLWREREIDGYLEVWARVHGERCCLNCFVPIPDGADGRKRFCGDKCRNAAKQRRHRERSPQAAERAQQKYWKSLGD